MQVKEKVQHAVEQAEEDFVPKTHEEELQSEGYIPRCFFYCPRSAVPPSSVTIDKVFDAGHC